MGPITYEVHQPNQRKKKQVYHVNLLKPWHAQEGLLITPYPPEPALGPQVPELDKTEEPQLGNMLSVNQQKQAQCLLEAFWKTFITRPGQTTVIRHMIQTTLGQVVQEATCPLPRQMREIVEKEIQTMVELGVIKQSQSEWRSPIVLVPKPDGSHHFCIDFRKVNAISKFDAYPMPRIDELLDRLGTANYITTLDLTKGYWQIPLDPHFREKTAFTTPTGLYQFFQMPFGLHGTPATFQRMTDHLLSPHITYAATYLDNVVIYSHHWEEHLLRVVVVLWTIRNQASQPTQRNVGLDGRKLPT
ncbi:unnamed protein product [Natator depressus]